MSELNGARNFTARQPLLSASDYLRLLRLVGRKIAEWKPRAAS